MNGPMANGPRLWRYGPTRCNWLTMVLHKAIKLRMVLRAHNEVTGRTMVPHKALKLNMGLRAHKGSNGPQYGAPQGPQAQYGRYGGHKVGTGHSMVLLKALKLIWCHGPTR